jgi:glycosyltransferase involved in cell wall biosynthesis
VTEVTAESRSVSKAISNRRIPLYTMKSTMYWFRRFPSWAFPALVVVTFLVHSIVIWYAIVKRRSDVRQADVLVVPHMGDTSVLIVKPLAVVLGIPLIYISHNGLYFPHVRNQQLYRKGSLSARMLFRLDRLMQRLSDRIIVFSEASAELFSGAFDVPIEKYEVIYIAVVESNFDKSIPTDNSLDCDVLYWGNFHPHHGPETMIEAAAALPEYEFAFVGRSSKRDHIVALAEEMGADNVHFPGYVELEKLVQYIKATQMVLGPVGDNPQTEFTIGTKVAEAGYMEKAIVVGRQPGTDETFTHRESAYLVEPGDPEALVEAIETILSDDDLRMKLERGSYRVYEEYFSTDRATERFVRIAETCR